MTNFEINENSINISNMLYNNYINYNTEYIKFSISGEIVDIQTYRVNRNYRLYVYIGKTLVINIDNYHREQFTKSAVIHILIHYFNLLQINYSKGDSFDDYCLEQLYKDYAGDTSLDLENFDWNIFNKTKFSSNKKRNIGSVFDHQDLDNYMYTTYPRLGRGNIVQYYYGVFNIERVNKGDLLISKGNEYKVIDTRIVDDTKVACVVKYHKVDYDSPLIISKDKIKYLISKDDLDGAWDSLYPSNRIYYRRKYFKESI